MQYPKATVDDLVGQEIGSETAMPRREVLGQVITIDDGLRQQDPSNEQLQPVCACKVRAREESHAKRPEMINALNMELYSEMGKRLHAEGRMVEAVRCYQTAIKTLKQDTSCFLVPMSLDLLMAGEWNAGWKVLAKEELMYKRLGPEMYRQVTEKLCKKEWDGNKDDIDRLIIVPEQGLGDMIQSLRFAIGLEKKFKVTTLTSPLLVKLLNEYSDIPNVSCYEENTSENTKWIPAMSLIRLNWRPGQQAPYAEGTYVSERQTKSMGRKIK